MSRRVGVASGKSKDALGIVLWKLEVGSSFFNEDCAKRLLAEFLVDSFDKRTQVNQISRLSEAVISSGKRSTKDMVRELADIGSTVDNSGLAYGLRMQKIKHIS